MTEDSWWAARNAADQVPEFCPYCGEKWKHCESFDEHLARMVDDE